MSIHRLHPSNDQTVSGMTTDKKPLKWPDGVICINMGSPTLFEDMVAAFAAMGIVDDSSPFGDLEVRLHSEAPVADDKFP